MRLFILFFLFSFAAFSQENPWENKNKENPWKTQEQKTTSTEKPTVDSVATVDTLYVNQEELEILLENAGEDGRRLYKSGGDFAFGFTSGLIFNYAGGLVSCIYMLPNSRKEKRVAQEVMDNPNYDQVEDETLEKEVKKSIKNKKILTTLGGVLAGSVTQIVVLLGITSI